MGDGTTEAPMTSGSKFFLTLSSLNSLAGTNHFWCCSSTAMAPTWFAWWSSCKGSRYQIKVNLHFQTSY